MYKEVVDRAVKALVDVREVAERFEIDAKGKTIEEVLEELKSVEAGSGGDTRTPIIDADGVLNCEVLPFSSYVASSYSSNWLLKMILKELKFPPSFAGIAPSSFDWVKSLEGQTLLFPSSCRYIGDGAFRNLSDIDTIRIENPNIYMGAGCFNNATAKKIILPGTVGYIGQVAFAQYAADEFTVPLIVGGTLPCAPGKTVKCTPGTVSCAGMNVKKITVADGNNYLFNSPFTGTKTEVAILPSSITQVRGNVFCNSSVLNRTHTVVLGDGWQTSLESGSALRYCPLTHESLTSMLNALKSFSSSTHTLAIGETNLAKLTDEEIAIATSKGWTLA